MASPRIRSAIQAASTWSEATKDRFVKWATIIKTSARRAADRESEPTSRTNDEGQGQWRTRPAVQKLLTIFTKSSKQTHPNESNRSKAQEERTPSPGRRDHFEHKAIAPSQTHPPRTHAAQSEPQEEPEVPELRPKSAEPHRITDAEAKPAVQIDPRHADCQAKCSPVGIRSDHRSRSAISARLENRTASPSPNALDPNVVHTARHSHLPVQPLARDRIRQEPPESRFATVRLTSDRKPRYRTKFRDIETPTFLTAQRDQLKSSTTLALIEMRRSSADRPLIRSAAIWSEALFDRPAVRLMRCSTGALQAGHPS